MYEAEIEAGMLLLDEKEGPLWDQRINEIDLRMNLCAHCILGQLYGWYSGGLEHLELDILHAYKYGFDVEFSTYPDEDAAFKEHNRRHDILGQEWIAAIIMRREARIGR